MENLDQVLKILDFIRAGQVTTFLVVFILFVQVQIRLDSLGKIESKIDKLLKDRGLTGKHTGWLNED